MGGDDLPCPYSKSSPRFADNWAGIYLYERWSSTEIIKSQRKYSDAAGRTRQQYFCKFDVDYRGRPRISASAPESARASVQWGRGRDELHSSGVQIDLAMMTTGLQITQDFVLAGEMLVNK
jgi:hypothetical protein